MPKVTEKLRQQWAWNKIQNEEERIYTQSGRKRPPEDIVQNDFDSALMDHLLSLPIGTFFDGQVEQARLSQQFDFQAALARVMQTYATD